MNEIEELRNRVNAMETLINSIVTELASQNPDPLFVVQEMRDRVMAQYEIGVRGEYLPARMQHPGTAKAIESQFEEIEKNIANMVA